jgi:acyl-CoA reductase-like NAD-dependent aldehyde dehydrogenase
MRMTILKVVSPVDGSVYVERELATDKDCDTTLDAAQKAQRQWRETTLEERVKVCEEFIQCFLKNEEEISKELSWQMGRPIAFTPMEVKTTAKRAEEMIRLAAEALAPIRLPVEGQLNRYIQRDPLGTVLVVPAWNYPYLIAVNSVVPALLAGNTVVLKHSSQTPLCAERFGQAFAAAGLPDGVFQWLHLSHGQTERMVGDPRVDFVAFTGSVKGGHAVVRAGQDRFIGMGLELGGKDPAYVRSDADLEFAVENLVDGAFFNSGQSCCGIERIYVAQELHDKFVDAYVAQVKGYRLGNPLEQGVNLGPVVKQGAAQYVQDEIEKARAMGAVGHINPADFDMHEAGTCYLAPQVLTKVDHSMSIMTEETFGPVVGIMGVSGDDEAVSLMNDSQYGLTASIWTADDDEAIRIGQRVDTGTFFQNRCDYLDPGLAWVGVKDSGRGCSLSRVGYEQLTRPKSFHLRSR